MLKPDQKRAVEELWKALSEPDRVWLAGHLSERAKELMDSAVANAPVLHIFYATETGNAKIVASQLEKQARARGYKTRNTAFSKLKLADLAALREPAVFLSSTHGEGDPPEMARAFFAALAAEKPQLPALRYAVLGLGDRAYKEFCKMGEVLDAAFAAGGAKAFHEKTLLDVDYTAHIPGWIGELLEALAVIAPPAVNVPAAAKVSIEPQSTEGFSRLEPIKGVVKDIVNLNDRGSAKETFHIEVAFEKPLAYSPGDSAGILMPPDEKGDVPTPRLYSIASSPLLHEKELHLTVAHASFKKPDGSLGYGLCSHFLAQKKLGDELQFYIQRNFRFRLPEDPAADVIMIGPGTGIAPFRAFLQERAESGASGRNWLFFGDQHARCDFLYQAEWQEWLENGALTRLDAAFSRDQKHKIYVQNRMQEAASELFNWINNGARIYVCGAKSPMSEDVEAALIDIIASGQGKQRPAAEEWLRDLAGEDHYLKDVY